MSEERFNVIRTNFGPHELADELSLEGFRSLSDGEADELIGRIKDYPAKAELRRFRRRTILIPLLSS